MSNEVKLSPIGAEEYILICKKVADKLREAKGLENDATAQSFISITDTIYTKLHKLAPEEPEVDEIVKPTTESILDRHELVQKIDPTKIYNVSYTVNTDGSRDYSPTQLQGKDLTENQIVELHENGEI